MRVMVVSDVHYERRWFRGYDESRAWGWLMGIVDYHKPDLLLGGGDWGSAVNEGEFYELLRRVVVLTIYGNHENMGVLTRLYNVRSDTYLPILMEDGRVYELGGLRVAGISGVISRRRKMKKGVPRRTAEEFLEYARRLQGRSVDVLLIHETPYLPSLFPFMQRDYKSEAALEAVRIARPRLVVNGHMHHGGYKATVLPWGTTYVYIDSSQQNRHYLILYRRGESLEVEVWRDHEKIDTVKVP